MIFSFILKELQMQRYGVFNIAMMGERGSKAETSLTVSSLLKLVVGI